MTTPNRFGFASDLQAETRTAHGRGDGFELFLDSATRWAHVVGRRLGATRQRVESEAMVKRPLTSLGIAFGLGVCAGWLVKRR